MTSLVGFFIMALLIAQVVSWVDTQKQRMHAGRVPILAYNHYPILGFR